MLTPAGRLVNSYGYALVVIVLCMDAIATVNCHLNVGVEIDKNGKCLGPYLHTNFCSTLFDNSKRVLKWKAQGNCVEIQHHWSW